MNDEIRLYGNRILVILGQNRANGMLKTYEIPRAIEGDHGRCIERDIKTLSAPVELNITRVEGDTVIGNYSDKAAKVSFRTTLVDGRAIYPYLPNSLGIPITEDNLLV